MILNEHTTHRHHRRDRRKPRRIRQRVHQWKLANPDFPPPLTDGRTGGHCTTSTQYQREATKKGLGNRGGSEAVTTVRRSTPNLPPSSPVGGSRRVGAQALARDGRCVWCRAMGHAKDVSDVLEMANIAHGIGMGGRKSARTRSTRWECSVVSIMICWTDGI